jgi:hypothetical protein
MPNLRSMIDGRTLHSAGIAPPIAPAPPPGTAGMGKNKLPQPGKSPKPAGDPIGKTNDPIAKPGKNGKLSPGAQHVQDHLSDPMGATKEGFTALTQKKMDYDNARENMQRELAMPQAVIDHMSQIHGLVPGGMPGQVPTPGMNQSAQPGQVDSNTGQPMDPNQDPNNPGQNDDPDMDPVSGNPQNMSQTVGKMNQNRPSMAGHQPGVAPGPSQNVVPGKMGMPKPGGTGQVNKPAMKPKGAGSMPGAKGPGDPKVAGKNNKAQGNSSRQVKISVAATGSLPVIKASKTISTTFGLEQLRAAGTPVGAKKTWSTRGKGHLSKKEKTSHYSTMESMMMQRPGSAGSGMRSPSSISGPRAPRGGPVMSGPKMFAGKKMKAGPAQLSDKVDDPGTELSYNPANTGSTKLNASKLEACMKCGKIHAHGAACKGM